MLMPWYVIERHDHGGWFEHDRTPNHADARFIAWHLALTLVPPTVAALPAYRASSDRVLSGIKKGDLVFCGRAAWAAMYTRCRVRIVEAAGPLSGQPAPACPIKPRFVIAPDVFGGNRRRSFFFDEAAATAAAQALTDTGGPPWRVWRLSPTGAWTAITTRPLSPSRSALRRGAA